MVEELWGKGHIIFIIFLSLVAHSLIYFGNNPQRSLSVEDNAGAGKPVYDTVIGVLSARDHFEQRQALRDTWVGNIKKNTRHHDRILVMFIVGDKPCPVPPEDRLDPYTCVKHELLKPVFDKDIIAYNVPHGTKGSHCHRGPLGMDFKVNFPIVVTQLGVFDSGSDGITHELVARLYDRISGEEVVNVTFTPSDPGQLIGGSRFKPVDQYVIPKGFEASIVAESFSESDPSNKVQMKHGATDSGGGMITFRGVSRYGVIPGEFPGSVEDELDDPYQYAAGTFMYRAYATDSGEFSAQGQQDKVREKLMRQERWEKMLKENESLLRQELEQHDDVLLVDSVEVYRNLSHKMMLFYKWATDNVAFNFTLKTDDDCYLDIDKILAALSDFNLRNRQKIWFSGFRTDWPVERHGKWREPEYTSSVYPAFACGAGNMLSADLVKWLAQNSGRLKHYQGEDVSLGIWLSAVGPTLVKDFNWQCMGDCDDNMYNSAQKAPAELREMWDNRVHCGNPCGCT